MSQTFQPTQKQHVPVRRRRLAWLILFLCVLAALAFVLTPVWLIQPFRPQTQTGLALSYVLRSWSPLVTLLLAALAALLCFWLARRARWWRKIVLVCALVIVCGLAWLARQNHFEWMFHPLPAADYARAPEAKFVADTDMVMAVQVNGEAVAYPVRLMAYHHVVADTVGGTPLVATY